MTSAKPKIWFIAPFPSPLNGQTNYNRTLLDALEGRADVICLETGKTTKDKLIRAWKNTWIVLFRIPRGATVYTSAPGQMGLWPFLLTIAALRIRGMDHFVHHHSFRGINLAPLAAHRWLARLGGAYQRHIFLSENMRDRYATTYLSDQQKKRALVVPNAFLFAQTVPATPHRTGPITIGHLSVMSREKGVDYIIDLITRLLPDADLRFVLGGPIQNAALRADIEALVAKYGDRVEWTGPIQGDAKSTFYNRTDLFILPSKLVDEADPLVLLESFAAGTVALASNRGCIPDRVMTQEHLLAMDPDKDLELLQNVVAQIAADRIGTARKAQAHATYMFQNARAQGQAFLAALGVRT